MNTINNPIIEGKENTPPKKYNLIVFDIDGTLLDTSEGLYSSITFVFNLYHLSLPANISISSFIGPPIQDSLKRSFPNFSLKEISDMALAFRNHYKEKDLFKAKFYLEIPMLLSNISKRGIKIAVATYKRNDYAETIMQHFGITPNYTTNVHGQDFLGRKTKSDIITECILESGINKEKSLMVGDSTSDYNGACGANIDFLPVTYGFGYKTVQDCYNIKHIGVAKSPKEISRFIL